MYSAVTSFSQKCAMGLATLLSGYLLSATGYVPSADPSADCKKLMLIYYVFVQSGGLLLAALAFFFYPLTHKRAEEVRRLINERKAAI
jgi:Na+/melibiose symporter-like transporter